MQVMDPQIADTCCISEAKSQSPLSLQENVAVTGQWQGAFQLPNVPIHLNVLPNGKVLYWGRRERPEGSMDEHHCVPFLWDPETRSHTPTPQPRTSEPDSRTVNLFCAGHAFLPDGRLLVAGGHFKDGHGDNQACLYDWQSNTWVPLPLMNNGRWYPTVITLADGSALVVSGSYGDATGNTPNNDISQIWDGNTWRDLDPLGKPLPLYPRLHLAPDGRVFFAGTNAECFLLDTAGQGSWISLGVRHEGPRDYAPSVMYDDSKIIYIGGGNDQGGELPSNRIELIDLAAPAPVWSAGAAMNFRRRQHNATVLADGTVLVTGGSQGRGFNDDSLTGPVHTAEIWDPATGQWTVVGSEDFDRLYHSSAVLLPDATVLSAGGGEGAGAYAQRNGQIFRPPYLFRGVRPSIVSAPDHVVYGESFQVATTGPEIACVSWIRLSSVTHAFNQNQRFARLPFTENAGTLTVTAPVAPQTCSPGHYMLFALSKSGVPSKAHIIRIEPGQGQSKPARVAAKLVSQLPPSGDPDVKSMHQPAKNVAHVAVATVGLTSLCPYGLGACWGGAYEALTKLDGVAAIDPVANAEDSTARVYLSVFDPVRIQQWPEQFARANGSYRFRGIELTLWGEIREDTSGPMLVADAIRSGIRLKSLADGELVQWDRKGDRPRLATTEERNAYRSITASLSPDGKSFPVRGITGPFVTYGDRFFLCVRQIEE
jgi:galactose oxidase